MTTSQPQSTPHVAVIGAGISGLIAARRLADHQYNVTVFDKGRGVGGRMSTRRVDGQPCFDHGAQYFTARDETFIGFVHDWMEQGIVARWPDLASDASQQIVIFKNGQQTQKPDSNERFVGTPAMNSICKHLATDLNVNVSTRVKTIEPNGDRIRLTDDQGQPLGEFDRIVISAPAAQAAELLLRFPSIANPISKIQMQPCWAAMVSFTNPIANDWVGSFIHDSILTWAARNSTKPGRPDDAEHLLLHAAPEWTAENWDRDPDQIAAEMLQAFWECSGINPQTPTHIKAHRWKFAIPVDPPASRCFFDAEIGIVACGDWAGGPRVEGAFLSGMAAADCVIGT